MAELILRPDDTAVGREGDILCAFNDRRIQSVHAQHLCDHKKLGFNGDGLRRKTAISYKFLNLAYQYRFERSGNTVIRIDLLTGEEETFSNTPNAKGEYIDVELFLKRRLENPKHRVFGRKGREVWFGGKFDDSEININRIWNMIETDSPNRKADHTLWPLTKREKQKFVILNVEGFDDAEAAEYESPLLDLNGEPIRHRKNRIRFEDIPEISEDTWAKVKDQRLEVDNRRGTTPLAFKGRISV